MHPKRPNRSIARLQTASAPEGRLRAVHATDAAPLLHQRAGDEARAQLLTEAAMAATRRAMASGGRSFLQLLENAARFLMRGWRAAALEAVEAGVRAGWKDAANVW